MVAHLRRAEDLLLDVVARADRGEDRFSQLVAAKIGGVDCAGALVELRAEDVVELAEDCIEVPLVGVLLLRRVLFEDVGEDGGDVVLGDELLLIDALHQLTAQAVDGLALLVHDVVVLEDVFAGLEVLRFDGLLRGFDAPGDHAALDGDALFHAEALEQSADPLAREDTHKVVFEREEEARAAGVSLAACAATKLVVHAAGLVALGAEDVQAAGGDDGLVLSLRGVEMRGDCRVPCGFGGLKLLAGVVEALHAGAGGGGDGSLGGGDGAGLRLFDEVLSRHELGVAAEQDVCAAAGHVGGDGDHAKTPCLGDDFGFLLVELCVEDDVADALALEDVAKQLGLFDGGGADQHGLLVLVQAYDLVGDGKVFFLGGAEDDVGIFQAAHRHIGWSDDDVQLVDLVELGGLGLCRAGHTGELLVHAEVVLKGDGGERLVFLADGDAFLGFDGLMEAVGPSAAWHETAGELVDDDDFALFDDVLDVAFVEVVCLDGDLDVVLEVPVLGVGDVADAEEFFDLLPALVGNGDGACLLVDDEVAGPGFCFEGLDQLAFFEVGDDEVDAGVLVGGLVGGTGDDERGAGLVDEDGVDFVDDAEVVAALDHVLEIELHVVAQIVEAELIVSAVCDVGAVCLAALGVIQIVDDDADGEA